MVSQAEIVEALRLLIYVSDKDGNTTSAQLVRQNLATRIEAEGIAPPDGYVSIASVLAALPKLGEPVSQDSFEYRQRYERFVKDMRWVRANIALLDTRRKLPHE